MSASPTAPASSRAAARRAADARASSTSLLVTAVVCVTVLLVAGIGAATWLEVNGKSPDTVVYILGTVVVGQLVPIVLARITRQTADAVESTRAEVTGQVSRLMRETGVTPRGGDAGGMGEGA